jgi:hypothetical protein
MAGEGSFRTEFSSRRETSVDLDGDVPLSMSLRLERLKLAETLRAEQAAILRAGENVRRAFDDFGQRLQPPRGGSGR